MRKHILNAALLALMATAAGSQAAISRTEVSNQVADRSRDYVIPTFKQEVRNPRPALRQISGAATKGPIADALISVYEIDDTGAPIGSAVATSTSDSSGEFSVSLPASAFGMLLVKTSGGSFIDESDTRPLDQKRRITLGSDEGFRSIILNSQSTVAVTPYTDAMIESAMGSSRLGGFKTKMQEIMTASTEGFGFSIFDTLPTNPADPDSSASNDAKQYALLLGATANIANVASLQMGMAAPTFEVLKAMVYDISDGSNDGMRFGQPILVNGQAFPAVDFDQQIARFRNNNFASYPDTALPGWDAAEDVLSGGDFAPGEIFSYFVEPIPRRWGIRTFGAARSEQRGDGTGTHWNGTGGGEYIWGEVNGELILDFTPFGGKENSAFSFFRTNDQGVQEEVSITTYLEQIVYSFGPNGLQAASSGRSEQIVVATGEVLFSDVFENSPVPIRVVNKKDAPIIEDNPPEFEESPALPQLIDGRRPQEAFPIYVDVDGMTFNADGTGVTSFDGDTFSWQLSADRKDLKVDFDNGESAVYSIVFLDDPELGDFVAADYTDSEGNRFFISSRVLSNFEDLVFTPDLVNRQVFGPQSIRLSNGAKNGYDRVLNFYSDGTGVQEFISLFDLENGNHIFGRSGFCWTIASSGRLTMTFGDFGFDEGFVPTAEQCAAQDETNRIFTWDIDLYDEFNDEVAVVLGESDDSFGTEEYKLTGVIPMILRGGPTFSANPPLPVDDVHSTTPSEPITIDPFVNDVVGSQAIDPSTVEITGGPLDLFTLLPANGTVSVNPATGAVTYTPDASNTAFRDVEMNYRYRDVTGNQTSQGRIFISIAEQGPSLPPLSSLSGIYSGDYSWNCGPGLADSTTMLLDISHEVGSTDVFGTVTLFGSTTSITGTRLDLPSMGPFGFEGGTPDPDGTYLHLFYNEVEPAFAQNELSLEISETGLVGIARNGDSDVGGGNGCALSSGAAGSIGLIKQSTASPRLKSGRVIQDLTKARIKQ